MLEIELSCECTKCGLSIWVIQAEQPAIPIENLTGVHETCKQCGNSTYKLVARNYLHQEQKYKPANKRKGYKPANRRHGYELRGKTLEEKIAWFLERSIKTPNGCIEYRSPYKGIGDYGLYPSFSHNNKCRAVVRWLLEQQGHDMTGKVACHRCDNPRCINVQHLFVGTNVSNSRDAVLKGRAPAQKLTCNDVLHIRELHSTGKYNLSVLARMYNVTKSSIWRCVTSNSRYRWNIEQEGASHVG